MSKLDELIAKGNDLPYNTPEEPSKLEKMIEYHKRDWLEEFQDNNPVKKFLMNLVTYLWMGLMFPVILYFWWKTPQREM